MPVVVRPALHQEDDGAYGIWLAVAAVAYSVLHHLGSVPDGFGAPTQEPG